MIVTAMSAYDQRAAWRRRDAKDDERHGIEYSKRDADDGDNECHEWVGADGHSIRVLGKLLGDVAKEHQVKRNRNDAGCDAEAAVDFNEERKLLYFRFGDHFGIKHIARHVRSFLLGWRATYGSSYRGRFASWAQGCIEACTCGFYVRILWQLHIGDG